MRKELRVVGSSCCRHSNPVTPSFGEDALLGLLRGGGVEGAAGGVFEADVISASGLYGTLASVKVVSFGAALDVMGNRAVGGVLPPPHTAVTSARAHFLSGWSWGRSLDGEREESSQRRRHGVVEVARDSRA